MKKFPVLSAGVVGALVASVAIAGPAAADDVTVSDLVNVSHPNGGVSVLEVAAQGEDLIVPIGAIVDELPVTAEHPITFEDGVELSLPADAVGDVEIQPDGTLLYGDDATADVTHVSVHEEGVRIANVINEPQELHVYEYDVENAELDLLPDGSISVTQEGIWIDADGTEIVSASEIAIIDAPWATDSVGNPVQTRYELFEGGFRQIVEPDENTVYPIVADPNWVKIATCAAAIAWTLGSTLFAAAKILRIKNYIRALGGTKEAVPLLLRATTAQERLRVGGTALKNLAAELLGVTAIAKACF